jgi:hypothetical protein
MLVAVVVVIAIDLLFFGRLRYAYANISCGNQPVLVAYSPFGNPTRDYHDTDSSYYRVSPKALYFCNPEEAERNGFEKSILDR